MGVNSREIGQRIRALRIKNKMTQQELAYAVDVSLNTVGKIESGIRMPSVDMFVMISSTFGVTLDFLILGRK